MHRKELSTVILTFVLVGFLTRAAWAATKLDVETIKAGLQTVTKEEDGFVQRVVTLMDQGKLPRKTVETAYLWAKRKPQRKFQYFRQALILLAARQGIKIN